MAEAAADLGVYYARLFPCEELWAWLSACRPVRNREFSFTRKGESGEIVLRHRGYSDAAELAAALSFHCPLRVDLGAVMSLPPEHRWCGGLPVPVAKELVFDIDLTDYDAVRSCCAGDRCCSRCWSYAVAAVRVLEHRLRAEFGFRHLLWVFSGRRGVHCWVSDERALRLTDEERAAIAQALRAQPNDSATSDELLSPPLGPGLQAVVDIVEPIFVSRICDEAGQDLFNKGPLVDALLSCTRDEAFGRRLRRELASWPLDTPAREKWDRFKQLCTSAAPPVGQPDPNGLRPLVNRVLIHFLSPRLDVKVTIAAGHLLKSPFSVHPGTGRVCVPFEPATCHLFDPTRAPTLRQLIEEQAAGLPSSMRPCVEILKSQTAARAARPPRASQLDSANWPFGTRSAQ